MHEKYKTGWNIYKTLSMSRLNAFFHTNHIKKKKNVLNVSRWTIYTKWEMNKVYRKIRKKKENFNCYRLQKYVIANVDNHLI